MLLAVDIGNTNVAFGLFKGNRLVKKTLFPTGKISQAGVAGSVKRSYGKFPVDAVIICSVVPKAEKKLVKALKEIFKVKPLILGKDIKIPIKNLYKKPKQVGQDRLVNAYAGSAFYKTPLIIIDFGTAVTFDIVSGRGAYLGGIIAPGVDLSLNALAEKAALLPKIRLKKIPPILGKTTSESMASGIFYGFASMCDGMVARLNKAFSARFNVVATGGNARLITKSSASVRKIDDDLILKGINLIFHTPGNPKKSPKKRKI